MKISEINLAISCIGFAISHGTKNQRPGRKALELIAHSCLLKVGTYTPEEYMQEENRLNSELSILQSKEEASDFQMQEVIKDVLKLSELLNLSHEFYKFATSEEKSEIIHTIFSELSLSGNTLKYKCKNGFQALESLFYTVWWTTGLAFRTFEIQVGYKNK